MRTVWKKIFVKNLGIKMLDLDPKDLAIVKKILTKYVSNATVWAYGSRVTGKSHAGSDLDLVIINDNNINPLQNNIAALRTAFSESDLSILVDILDWSTISDSFKENIKQNYIVIQ